MKNDIVRINQERIEAMAELIKSLPDDGRYGLNFYSFAGQDGQEIIADKMYPALNHPQAVNFFFFICVQQFGFWYGDYRGYREPLCGILDGKKIKGSDLLWQLGMRQMAKQEDFFAPENLARLAPAEFSAFLSDDNGPIPFPDWEIRYLITAALASSFCNQGADLKSPEQVVAWANQRDEKYRLREFVDFLLFTKGWSNDHLHKKASLLAMALSNRPEHFLHVKADSPEWMPIVDYHLMRLCLRLGLVELIRDYDKDHNAKRRWVSGETANYIRGEVFNTVYRLMELSGKPMAFIDDLMQSAINRCPEMSEPDCEHCRLAAVCAKRTELFQPVFRTTAY